MFMTVDEKREIKNLFSISINYSKTWLSFKTNWSCSNFCSLSSYSFSSCSSSSSAFSFPSNSSYLWTWGELPSDAFPSLEVWSQHYLWKKFATVPPRATSWAAASFLVVSLMQTTTPMRRTKTLVWLLGQRRRRRSRGSCFCCCCHCLGRGHSLNKWHDNVKFGQVPFHSHHR